MRTTTIALIMLLSSFNVQAYSNFIENPYTPYPPGCATLPDLQTELYGDNVVKVAEQEIEIWSADINELLSVNLAVYRIVCSDPGQSVLLLEFAIPARLDPSQTYYALPGVSISLENESDKGKYMRLSSEPGTWGSADQGFDTRTFGGNTPGTTDGHDRRWRFVLDKLSPWSHQFNEWSNTPVDYNGNIELALPGGMSPNIVRVPSTASLQKPNPRIPLSGRLSGNWVVDGASDQGFVIAISELVPDTVPAREDLADSPLLMFLSWYTYDANGDMLWLTGAAQFAMGDTEVTIPIEDVSNGEFMGSKTADRSVVGNVTITGNNCNDLTLQYDLGDIGLGSGTKHLERLFSLETAGYVCRDLEARIDAANSTAAFPPAHPSPSAIDVESLSLAFVRGETIFGSALDGSEPIELVKKGTQPAWSPDGTRLAFTRPADNSLAKWQLCIAQADGTGIRCATGKTDGNVQGVPTWSPDGTMVAFSVFVHCKSPECPNGGYFSSLSLLDTSTMQVTTLDTPPVWSASWSPDGRRIAIAMFGVGNYGRGALGIMNTDGSGLEVLANSFGSYSVHYVAWSPDGGRLALTLLDEHACPWFCDTAIGVINADGTQLKVLDRVRTSDDVYFWTPPAWSPDGGFLAYTVSRGDSCYLYHVSCNEIAVVDVASGQVGRLLSSAAYPSWRP